MFRRRTTTLPRALALAAVTVTHELAAPGLLSCVREGAPTYAWPFESREVWCPPTSWSVRMARRVLPPVRRV